MAETIGAIQVVATINTKDYEAAKKSIEKGNDQLEAGAVKTSRGFGGAWIGAIAGVAASLTGTFLGAIKSSIGNMTELYDASIKFPKVLTTMGASGKEASDAFKDMKKYADLTIYSLDDMTKTYGSLYGIAGKSSGPLVKALGGVSTLAANAGQAMQSWSLQLTQMVAKPKIAWQDFRILLEQNPAAIAKIAQSMGKTTSQIIKDVNNQTLSTKDFLDALKKVGNDKSLQKAATSSDTFGNSIGQLQASIASAGAKMLDTFGPLIIESINGVSSAFDTASDSFDDLVRFIKRNKNILLTLASAIAGSTAAIITFNAYTKAAAVVVGVYTVATTALAAAQSAHAQGLGILRSAWFALNIVMSANPIGFVITVVAGLIAALSSLFFWTNSNKTATDGLNISRQTQKQLADAARDAENKLKDALFNAQGAALAVEQAQKNYNDAVKQYGPKSLEARQAAHDLSGAQNDLKKANQDAKTATDNNRIAQEKFANPGVIGTIVRGVNKISGAILGINNSAMQATISIGNLQSAATGKKLQGAVNSIQNTSRNIQSASGISSLRGMPHLASGGVATGPTIAMIGEGKYDEAVIPLPKLDDMLENVGGNNANVPPINVTIQARTIDSRNDLRNIALETINAYNEVLQSKGIRPLAT